MLIQLADPRVFGSSKFNSMNRHLWRAGQWAFSLFCDGWRDLPVFRKLVRAVCACLSGRVHHRGACTADSALIAYTTECIPLICCIPFNVLPLCTAFDTVMIATDFLDMLCRFR